MEPPKCPDQDQMGQVARDVSIDFSLQYNVCMNLMVIIELKVMILNFVLKILFITYHILIN
jgi:hypothetical protein